MYLIGLVEFFFLQPAPSAPVKYGSNSYSGAINIVLKKIGQKAFYVGGGSDGFLMACVRAGQNNNQVFLNLQDIDGYDFQFLDEQGTTGNVDDYVKNSNFTWIHQSKNHKVLANTYRGGEGYLGVLPRNVSGAGIEHELEVRLISYEYKKELNEKANSNSTLPTIGTNLIWPEMLRTAR